MVDVSKIRTDWEDVSEADWQVNSARAQANRLAAEPLNALGLGVIEALSQGGTPGSVIKVGGTAPADGWHLDNGGTIPADTTPPNPGTLGVSAQTSTGFTLTVTGASDAGGLHAQPYRFSLDNGSTYSAWQASNVYVATGLTASTTYQVRVAVRDAAGNEATAETAASTTAGGGGGDTTAPTAGTLAASAITSTTFTLTVTGASDAGGLHATPYAFSTDNGATWSAYQAGATYNVTGKTASTAYQARHKVRDAALNETTGTAITVTTSAASTNITDDFTGADGTVVGRTTTTGGKVWAAATDGQTAGVESVPLLISGNALSNSGATRSALLPVGLTRYSAEAAYTAGAGVVIRLNICTAPTTSPNFNGGGITYQFSTNGAYVIQGTGGAPAVVGVVNGATGVASGTLKVQYDGTTLTGWHNGNLVASAAVALTGTNLTVHISGSSPWGYLDDLVITPLP